MKKLLIIFLVLAVTGGVFAQVTATGGVRTDFGVGITTAPSDVDPQWVFGVKNGGTNIGVQIEAEPVTAWVKVKANGDWAADATVDIGPAQLSVGLDELRWAQWSSFDLWGDNHWGFGAAASDANPYIQFGIAGFYAGLTEAGWVDGSWLSSKYDVAKNSIGVDENGDPIIGTIAPFTGFYLGYEFDKEDTFSAGAAFAAAYRGKDVFLDDKGNFPFMIDVHGKLLMLDPITLGLNVALYNAPANGFFAIAFGDAERIIGGNEAFVVEGLLDVAVALDPCTIGFAAGLVANLADDNKGGGGAALKLGLSANFNVGGGFFVIPGLGFTAFLKNAGGTDADYGRLDLGLSLGYSF